MHERVCSCSCVRMPRSLCACRTSSCTMTVSCVSSLHCFGQKLPAYAAAGVRRILLPLPKAVACANTNAQTPVASRQRRETTMIVQEGKLVQEACRPKLTTCFGPSASRLPRSSSSCPVCSPPFSLLPCAWPLPPPAQPCSSRPPRTRHRGQRTSTGRAPP